MEAILWTLDNGAQVRFCARQDQSPQCAKSMFALKNGLTISEHVDKFGFTAEEAMVVVVVVVGGT